jgi:N6-adenosine-specific RNA methylase IME4
MIPFHPLADIFPLIEGQDFDDLVRDIQAHGLREPIEILDGKILDGRNRYRACVAAGILPESLDRITPAQIKYFHWFVPLGAPSPSDEELWSFILSKNLHRRHMSASQRAIAMSDYEAYRHGGARRIQDANLHLDGIEPDKSPPTRADLAERGKVSERLLASAAVVRDHAAPELKEAVRRGDLAVSAAEEIAHRPADEQRAILGSLPRDDRGKLTPEAKKALAPVIKEIRSEKQIEKKQRRDDREAELGRKLLAMPEKKYGVAIEDFEWDHKPWSRETGMDRHPSNHYPTASDAHTPEEIVARTVERFKCLADTCVLYMWTTIPHEAIAHKVLELRGFKYVSQRVWDKVRAGAGRGPGYWVTGEHEILLIAVRGNVVPPATAHFRSRFEAPVGAHSEKPDQQYEHAEFHFPTLPKIELNARRARAGWDTWGFEAPNQGEAA